MLYEAVGGRGLYKTDFQETFRGRSWTGKKNIGQVTYGSTSHEEATKVRRHHTRARGALGQRKKISKNGRTQKRDRRGEISTSGGDIRKVLVNYSMNHPYCVKGERDLSKTEEQQLRQCPLTTE